VHAEIRFAEGKRRIMKKMIEVKYMKEEKKTVGVEFPLYRRHDVSGDDYESVIYSRIEEGIEEGYKEISIQKSESYRSNSITFELEIESYGTLEGSEYALGLGKYASSEEEFNSILAELNGVFEQI
jgi:hypothetical protein